MVGRSLQMQLPRSRRLRRDLVAAAVVAAIVFAEVGVTFHVFTELRWDDPIAYLGDAQFPSAAALAITDAAMMDDAGSSLFRLIHAGPSLADSLMLLRSILV